MTEPAAPPLLFYFDYISPYAYLAWHRLPALAARHGRTITPIPVLFAAMLTANDTRGPAEIPSKRDYVFIDVLRSAAHLGLPLEPPPAHPFSPLLALRVTGLEMPAAARTRLISGLFGAVWGGGPGVTEPEVVARIAEDAGIPDALARAAEPAAKARLRADTAAAMAAGVFGVPSVRVDGELFWGNDSLDHLERFLASGQRVDPVRLARWRSLPAAAQRKEAGEVKVLPPVADPGGDA